MDHLKAFDSISKIEVDYLDGDTLYKVSTGEVTFDWDSYYLTDSNGEKYLAPSCSSIALFDDIQKVKSIRIYVEPQSGSNITGLSVAEVTVIGK